MAPIRKLARLTFLEDSWGRISVRDEDKNPVSVEDMRALVDRFAAHPAPYYLTTKHERELLARYTETFRPVERPGYVYVIRRADGLIKIGQTGHLKDRIKAIRTNSQQTVDLLHVVFCQDRVTIESYLHRIFAEKHIDGEWFELDEHDLAVIMAREQA